MPKNITEKKKIKKKKNKEDLYFKSKWHLLLYVVK